jgi:hypothetical protein
LASVCGGQQILVKLFDQARKFTALEAFCTAKNVINGTHRIQFTAHRRLVYKRLID